MTVQMLHNPRIVFKELVAGLSFTGFPFLPQFPDLEIKVHSQCYAGNQYLSPDQNSRFLASILHSDHTFLLIAMGKKVCSSMSFSEMLYRKRKTKPK